MARTLDPFAVCFCDMPLPVQSPEHAPQSALPPTAPPSLHALRRRPHPVSQGHHGFVRALRQYYEARPTPHLFPNSVPIRFLSRSGIAQATADQMRPPRFQRRPCERDRVCDPGGATIPRITVPHMLPSVFATASASATLLMSWLNRRPHSPAVYASPQPSPTRTQHSLPGGLPLTQTGLPPARHRQPPGAPRRREAGQGAVKRPKACKDALEGARPQTSLFILFAPSRLRVSQDDLPRLSFGGLKLQACTRAASGRVAR